MDSQTQSDLDTIRPQLNPPVKRGVLIQIVSLSQNIPPAFKGMAFMALSGMKQKELDNIGGLIGQALDYVVNQDMPGLDKFFADNKIPPQISELFKHYASNILKK